MADMKKFLEQHKRMRESALAAVRAKPTDTERIGDLEAAVAALSAAIPLESAKDMAKLYSNMVALESIAANDVPAAFKTEVGKILKQDDSNISSESRKD